MEDNKPPSAVDVIHFMLDIVGMFPEPFSTLSDLTNTILYIAQQIDSFVNSNDSNYVFDVICGVLSLGLAGISTGVLKTFLKGPAGEITPNTGKILSAIKAGFGKAANLANSLATYIKNLVKTQIDKIIKAFDKVYFLSSSRFDSLKSALNEVVDKVTDFFDNASDALADELDDAGAKIAGIACLVAGTQILTSEGYKSIELIETNDLVYSMNLKTGKIELKPVYGTYVGFKQDIYTIKTSSETVIATSEHPFWVDGKGWVEAEALTTSDLLMDSSGDLVEINQISHEITNGTKV